ncbi:hypothetical protein D9758_001296 [Tetrapyrgos nigripes]|uniref:GAR domain-containing protein n=1 Tax=Tetrapyrgos nigripes TaxID=182062 RepID=A0A8H5GRT1_9AGAR|nr:hypothetical protein D9758_001296 [Tetrapyrgos nigripes]
MAEASSPPVLSGKSSGTTVVTRDEIQRQPSSSSDSSILEPENPTTRLQSDMQEEALESHEVIELQTFSERKAWIQDKIKLLEKMPPVQVFVGLQALKSSAEDVPGLPTREELQRWLEEHDAIEKESEIFDTGELKKLRKFTRAATQRNLSPEDTDLIELTLTTIYDLDKLLHLLRDRSENLDLLGVRLTWEEHRKACWVDRRKIIADLKDFLDSRARWSPAVYESNGIPETSAEDHRRGSIGSIASVSSEASINSPGFSRSTRFKLAELLSRDAASFGSRVTLLRHGPVAASGKVLDKLIDSSRKPVPEELLDEQDKVEERCNEMEAIGKFAMNAVMQWRKADEIYVETMKDQYAAQKLLEDIEFASLQHPSARQSSSFVTRAEALLKRLHLRGNPASPNSAFPHPQHPLFPEQTNFNANLAEELSSELTTTLQLATKAYSLAKEYRESYEAVKRVEMLVESVAELGSIFNSIIDRVENGVVSTESDGSPPSLTSNECLEPIRYSAFLALFPSISEELSKANLTAEELMRTLPAALAHLDFPGVDAQFKADAVLELQRLNSLRSRAGKMHNDMVDRIRKLREIRRIWSIMEVSLKELEVLRREVADEMERCRWRQDSSSRVPGAPPTPESPLAVPLPLTSATEAEYDTRLSAINNKIAQMVKSPLDILSPSVDVSLMQSLSRSADGLQAQCNIVQRPISLLQSIRNQATQMRGVRDDFNNLQMRINDAIIRYEQHIQAVLDGNADQVHVDNTFAAEPSSVQAAVDTFIDSLSRRVPFVTPRPSLSYVRRSFSSLDLLSTMSDNNYAIEIPIDIQALDEAVRTDCNSYTVRVNGQVRTLEQKSEHLVLARITKELDAAISIAKKDVDEAISNLSSLQNQYISVMEKGDVSNPLELLSQNIEHSSNTETGKIKSSLSAIDDVLKCIPSTVRHSTIHDSLIIPRNKIANDLRTSFAAWEANVRALQDQVLDAQRAEQARLEQARIEEEQRLQDERERLALEAAEQERLEKERLEAERRRLEEEARLAEEARIQAQKEEEARIEKERQEAAEKRRREEERAEEERRIQAEKERLAAEERERSRMERERQEIEMKLKIAQERLEEERRLHAEKERIAAEEAEKARLAREQLEEEHRQLQMQHQSSPPAKPANDVFGPVASADASSEMKDMATLVALRRRLRDIGINDALASGSPLPGASEAKKMRQEFALLSQAVASFPTRVESPSVGLQLKSFKKDLEISSTMLERVEKLAEFSETISACDSALSDLLEHIDSYPSAPLGPLSSSYTSSTKLPPEEQLSGRISFTRELITNMSNIFDLIKDNSRAHAEHDRVLQTWIELEEMGSDRISGRKSRPSSVLSSRDSSGRNSSVSVIQPTRARKKTLGYSVLSASPLTPSSTPRGRLGVPIPSHARRAVSNSDDTPNRSDSRASDRSFQRSTSGPLGGTLMNPTFASRQRTNSLTPSTSSTPRRSSGPQPRIPSGSLSKRSESPSVSSDASSANYRSHTRARTSSSLSTWSRAPRVSFPSIPRASTPQKKSPAPRKKYVANPKSKLDVAVGDVVNNLPVGINIEGVSGSWKDQSGKYWIGDQDPRLCFCRILRSQTVMVRVGGGWTELSKFIRTHFADSFRLLSESPVINNNREEKWISSATLLESAVEYNTSPGPPKTPEPFLPSFSISPPNGKSPQSFRSSPSTKGSPSALTPLQFIRRADNSDAVFLRPETPSRAPRTGTAPHTPIRHSVWRP